MQTSGNNSDNTAATSGITKSTGFSQFPDIPIPSGARMNVEKTLVFGSNPWFGQLVLNIDSSAGIIFDFFRNSLPEHNWEEVTSVRAKTSILTYMQKERVLAIAIQSATLGGSGITITVSPRGTQKASPKNNGGQNDLMPVPVTKIK